MKKENYNTPSLRVVAFSQEDVIRTSSIFSPNEAPDVYEKDPFTNTFIED